MIELIHSFGYVEIIRLFFLFGTLPNQKFIQQKLKNEEPTFIVKLLLWCCCSVWYQGSIVRMEFIYLLFGNVDLAGPSVANPSSHVLKIKGTHSWVNLSFKCLYCDIVFLCWNHEGVTNSGRNNPAVQSFVGRKGTIVNRGFSLSWWISFVFLRKSNSF